MLLSTQAFRWTACRSSFRALSTPADNGRTLQALYADRAVLVVNKPPGVDSQLRKSHSVMRDLLVGMRYDCQVGHPFPVHRLDLPTTGVLICATTKSAISDLHDQFRNRTVGKIYLAIVRAGKETFSSSRGKLQDHLRPDRGYMRVTRDPVQGDKLASTSWEVLASSPVAPLSLVKLEPETGFKHQLRTQLANSGAPILGDTKHSMSSVHRSILRVTEIAEDRLYLHAAYSSFFRYRKDRRPKQFRLGVMAPLPAYFVELCRKFEIPLEEKYIKGGVYINEEPATIEALEDIGGKWLF